MSDSLTPWTAAHQIQVQLHHLFLIISCLFGEHFKVWPFEYFKSWFKFFLQSSCSPWIVSLVYFLNKGLIWWQKDWQFNFWSINWGIIASGLNKSDRKQLVLVYLGKNHIQNIHTLQCSLQHYLQQPRHESNLNVHQQRNGYGRCGIWYDMIYIYI